MAIRSRTTRPRRSSSRRASSRPATRRPAPRARRRPRKASRKPARKVMRRAAPARPPATREIPRTTILPAAPSGPRRLTGPELMEFSMHGEAEGWQAADATLRGGPALPGQQEMLQLFTRHLKAQLGTGNDRETVTRAHDAWRKGFDKGIAAREAKSGPRGMSFGSSSRIPGGLAPVPRQQAQVADFGARTNPRGRRKTRRNPDLPRPAPGGAATRFWMHCAAGHVFTMATVVRKGDQEYCPVCGIDDVHFRRLELCRTCAEAGKREPRPNHSGARRGRKGRRTVRR